ncbi:unnamed protein product [Cunninghamella blakesleeana]
MEKVHLLEVENNYTAVSMDENQDEPVGKNIRKDVTRKIGTLHNTILLYLWSWHLKLVNKKSYTLSWMTDLNIWCDFICTLLCILIPFVVLPIVNEVYWRPTLSQTNIEAWMRLMATEPSIGASVMWNARSMIPKETIANSSVWIVAPPNVGYDPGYEQWSFINGSITVNRTSDVNKLQEDCVNQYRLISNALPNSLGRTPSLLKYGTTEGCIWDGQEFDLYNSTNGMGSYDLYVALGALGYIHNLFLIDLRNERTMPGIASSASIGGIFLFTELLRYVVMIVVGVTPALFFDGGLIDKFSNGLLLFQKQVTYKQPNNGCLCKNCKGVLQWKKHFRLAGSGWHALVDRDMNVLQARFSIGSKPSLYVPTIGIYRPALYIAVSHVWDEGLVREDGVWPCVWENIVTCMDHIGAQYVWIDSACLRSDWNTRKDQLGYMGCIYQRAMGTILVTKYSEFTDIVDENKCKWASRVWTVQEWLNSTNIFLCAKPTINLGNEFREWATKEDLIFNSHASIVRYILKKEAYASSAYGYALWALIGRQSNLGSTNYAMLFGASIVGSLISGSLSIAIYLNQWPVTIVGGTNIGIIFVQCLLRQRAANPSGPIRGELANCLREADTVPGGLGFGGCTDQPGMRWLSKEYNISDKSNDDVLQVLHCGLLMNTKVGKCHIHLDNQVWECTNANNIVNKKEKPGYCDGDCRLQYIVLGNNVLS